MVNIFRKSGDELVFFGKRTYYYDGNKKLLEDITEDLINDTLKFSTKNQYTLDDNNNIIDSTYFTWNSDDGVWNENYRTSSTFNAEGQKIFAFGQRWRNNTWENNRYYIYQYNESNIIDTVFSKRWGQGNWRNTAFIVYIYDEENNLTETITKAYWGNNIINFSKVEYVYEDNRLSEISNYLWQNNDWVLQDTQTFDYDDNGKLIMIMIMKTENVGWLANTQNLYFYDEQNNLLQDLTQRFVNEEWQDNSRVNYTFDKTNMLVQEEVQIWSPTSSSWSNLEKKEYSYNQDGEKYIDYNYSWSNNDGWEYTTSSTYTYDDVEKTFIVTNQKFVDSISTWINTTKTSTTFNDDNNPVISVTEKWNEMNNWYRNSSKSEYIYDESGFLIEDNYYTWLYNWSNDTKNIYTNNIQGIHTEQLIQKYIDSVWADSEKYIYGYDTENRIISQLLLKWSNSRWDSTEKQTFYYGEPNILGVIDLGNWILSLYNYPNPVVNNTTISLELTHPSYIDLRLHNNSGIEIKTISKGFFPEGVHHFEINTNNLPSGIYYYTLSMDKDKKTMKMIIVK